MNVKLIQGEGDVTGNLDKQRLSNTLKPARFRFKVLQYYAIHYEVIYSRACTTTEAGTDLTVVKVAPRIVLN